MRGCVTNSHGTCEDVLLAVMGHARVCYQQSWDMRGCVISSHGTCEGVLLAVMEHARVCYQQSWNMRWCVISGHGTCEDVLLVYIYIYGEFPYGNIYIYYPIYGDFFGIFGLP